MRDEKYSPLTIMVVEDDELGRKYIKALLQGIGVGLIIGAENGADALQVLEETDADVDLVICDVEMPELNGFEFARRVRYGTCRDSRTCPFCCLPGTRPRSTSNTRTRTRSPV